MSVKYLFVFFALLFILLIQKYNGQTNLVALFKRKFWREIIIRNNLYYFENKNAMKISWRHKYDHV